MPFRIAMPVHGLANRHADPPLAHAILFHVGFLDAVEPDAHAAAEHGRVVIPAFGIDAEPVGEAVVAHGDLG